MRNEQVAGQVVLCWRGTVRGEQPRAPSPGTPGPRDPGHDTVKIYRPLTTKSLTTFSSEENDDKPLSVDDMFRHL